MNPDRHDHESPPTRREVLRRGCLAGAMAGFSALPTGCAWRAHPDGLPGTASDGGMARVDLIRLTRPGRDRGPNPSAVIGRRLNLDLTGKTVFLQSSYLGRHPDHLVRAYLGVLGSLAERFTASGAVEVLLSADVPRGLASPRLKVIDEAARPEGRRSYYCTTRLSGRLRFEATERLSSPDTVLISAPLSAASGAPLLASTNLLGLVKGNEASPPEPDELEGGAGDLAVDVASTVRPRRSMNFLPAPGPEGDGFWLVMGAELSSVDAVTCRERGLSPDDVLPLRDLPCWLGPITPERIRCHRQDLA